MVSQKILHVDLDCFFAAVEMRDNPKYREKPVIIGADPKNGKGRGVVSTCSYEARKFGVHSAMPISQAYKLCPHGIYLHSNLANYKQSSDKVMNILKSYSNIFQQTSIDEAYIDVSEYCPTYYEAKKMANKIRLQVKNEVGITCSIGCGPTKSIAKIASDYNKPNGITIVEPDCIRLFLMDLDITRIPGIGKKSKTFYHEKNIFKIGDFYNIGYKKLQQWFGKHGEWIWDVITGNDCRIVSETHERKSISKERTFHKDSSDIDFVMQTLHSLNTKLHKMMKDRDINYKTISIKVRFRGFETFTRAKSLHHAFRDEKYSQHVIEDLLEEFRTIKSPFRLVGVRFSNLEIKERIKQDNLMNFLNSTTQIFEDEFS